MSVVPVDRRCRSWNSPSQLALRDYVDAYCGGRLQGVFTSKAPLTRDIEHSERYADVIRFSFNRHEAYDGRRAEFGAIVAQRVLTNTTIAGDYGGPIFKH